MFDISTETVFCNAWCLHHHDISTKTVFCNAMLLTTILISRLRLYFEMLSCLPHLDISNGIVFCSALLPTQSWYLDWDCILQGNVAHNNLLYLDWDFFAMLFCLHHLDISTKAVYCNALLITQSWYLDWDCILQCYAAYPVLMRLYYCIKLHTQYWYLDWDFILQGNAGHAILISQLRLYFAMLCLHNIDNWTETRFCNAMLPTPS